MCLRFLIQSPAQLMGFLVKTTSEFEEIHSHNLFFFWYPPRRLASREPPADRGVDPPCICKKGACHGSNPGKRSENRIPNYWAILTILTPTNIEREAPKEKTAKQKVKRKKGPLFFFIHKHKLIGLYIALNTYDIPEFVQTYIYLSI